MRELISITEASEHLLGVIMPVGEKSLPLEECTGRILMQAVVADRAIPPFDRVMMDGIAISHASFASEQREFPIAGTQTAGMTQQELTDSGSCLEVMTGASLPKGTDTVIKIEEISIQDGIARLKPDCQPVIKQHIHPEGSDSIKGATLLESGTLLRAPDLAIAASVGCTQLAVSDLPKITLITTGDEVIPIEQTPFPHQIRRSHATAISTTIENDHLGEISHYHIPDTPEALKETLLKAQADSDLILITGGISMGKKDYVAPVLTELHGEPIFHGVTQRPGKPLALWTTEANTEKCKRAIADVGAANATSREECKRVILCLPGNPVSVMACLARYVLPALRKLRNEKWHPEQLPLASDTTWNAPFPGLVACKIMNGKIHPCPPRNSGEYTALAGTHGICELPSTTSANTILNFYPW